MSPTKSAILACIWTFCATGTLTTEAIQWPWRIPLGLLQLALVVSYLVLVHRDTKRAA